MMPSWYYLIVAWLFGSWGGFLLGVTVERHDARRRAVTPDERNEP